MRAGHHRVRAGGERMRRQVWVEAQVRGPGGIDDERHAGLVRDLGVPGYVANRADIGRVAEEHPAGAGVRRERGPHGLDRDRRGQPGCRIHLRPHPDRAQPGEHQAEQHGPVQGAADDGAAPRLPGGQRQRLIAVRGAGHREPAPVRAPQPGGPALGLGPQRVGVLHGVEPAVQRRVARHHGPDKILALLVPGDAHRHHLAGLDLAGEPQPGVKQRGVGPQPARITVVRSVDISHPPSLHDHLAGRQGRPVRYLPGLHLPGLPEAVR